MDTPKDVGALHGAPTFTLTAEQMPDLKGLRSGHVCDFDLTAKLVSVDKDTYTFRWEALELDAPDEAPEDGPNGYPGMSAFKKAVYGGDQKAPRKVTYVRNDTGPSVS